MTEDTTQPAPSGPTAPAYDPIPPTAPPPRDLGIAKLAEPDIQWARMQPIHIVAGPERLNAEHQLVSIRNTSDSIPSFNGQIRPQVHIVIDRFMTGHEFQPGETKHDIDMLVDEIAYFLRQRAPNRRDQIGRIKPMHPIEIIGFQARDDEVKRQPLNNKTKAAA